MEQKRKCPYCGEEIMATAKKCKHCGEWLAESLKLSQHKQQLERSPILAQSICMTKFG